MQRIQEKVRGLIYINDEQPGFRRLRCGKGFKFLDEAGKHITDPEIRQRLKSLVIPPMWSDVWICTLENGHLQATGRDQKGRKQYIYHEKWTQHRQTSKFSKMVEFAEKLPLIRQTTRQHLNQRTWNKEKVLALIVQVMDRSYMRIGNEFYKKQNDTFGLTTLRRKHLHFDKRYLIFEYKGKSHQYRKVKLEDKKLVQLIRECSELPGYEVFRYLDEEGKSQPLDSSDVNAYLHTIAGEHFSSKDFRTWGGTVLAVKSYPQAKKEVEENPRRNLVKTVVEHVAEGLGNTVAVCREYYIHPKVLRAVEEEKIPDVTIISEEQLAYYEQELSREELIALQLITT